MTFNEKLKQALAENHNERISRSTAIEKPHRFSLAYKLWERKMLRDLRRNRLDKRWTLHKARCVVMAALTVAAAIMLSMTGCVVVNLAIGRFSFDDKNDHSKLLIENLSSDKTRIEEYYGLPEEDGWVIDNSYADDYASTISYTCGDESVVFRQKIIHGNMAIVKTENAVVEPISLYEENDGFYIIKFKNGVRGLWWIYDGYLFGIIGNFDKDTMTDLAYSIKIQKF